MLVRPYLPSKPIILYPPVSLLTFAPYLIDKHDVRICDLQSKGVLSECLKWNPDLVAITCYIFTMNEVQQVIDEVKSSGIKAKIVVGGAGITAEPEFAASTLHDYDAVVTGDGEPFAQQLESLNFHGIINMPFFDMNDKRFPAWDMIDHKQYSHSVGYAVETSRGCPRDCIWCTAKLSSGLHWRARKPEDIVTELVELKKLYNAKRFYFPDDNIALDSKRFKTLLQLIIDTNLHATFNVWQGQQAHNLDYETLVMIKKAGFESITLGAESGCQRVLDIIGKGLKVEKVEEVVKICKHIGLMVNCFFVIGTVGETLEEAKHTVEFAQHLRKLGAYSCIVRNAIPVIGTRMTKIAVEKGYLTVPYEKLRDFEISHSGKHFMRTPEWEPEQIEELVSIAMKQDAESILRRHWARLIRVGAVRIIREPKRATYRIKQLWSQLKGRGMAGAWKRDDGK